MFAFLGPALSLLTGGFGKLFAMIPAFLRWCFANPAWVLCAILGFMWGLSAMDARSAHKQAGQCAAARKSDKAAWQAASKINLASIDTLQAALVAKNKESQARADAYAASRAQDAADVAAADQRLRATTSQIARLRGIADHAAANPTCKAPDALLAGAEGL